MKFYYARTRFILALALALILLLPLLPGYHRSKPVRSIAAYGCMPPDGTTTFLYQKP